MNEIKYDTLVEVLNNQKDNAVVTAKDMAFILKELKPLFIKVKAFEEGKNEES